MSNNLESFVRPFQSEVSSPSPFYTPGQPGSPNIILRLGRGGSGGKTLNGSISLSISSYCERFESEKGQT